MRQQLINPEKQQATKKERRMSRSCCPICGLKNTFVIDSVGYWKIRLCLICAKEQGYEVDLSKAQRCLKCGELFVLVKSATCPVCWIEYFERQQND